MVLVEVYILMPKIKYLGRCNSAVELMKDYSEQKYSPVEIAEKLLRTIEEKDSLVQAMTLVTPELALKQAEESKVRFLNKTQRVLEGVPITIKDTFDIAGYVSTRGSKVFREQLAFEDSGVIKRLRAAGAVFLGKTNTAEFGQSATSENKLELTTGNPWKLENTPGGSSGGAAASVSAGYVPIALGADGGGSIRIPAAMTGVFGFKPSYGLCPDEGGFRGMSDFCCPGPLTHSVADARLFLSVIADKDWGNSRKKSGKRKIAFCPSPGGNPVHPAITTALEKAADLLSNMGHQVERINIDIEGWNEVFGPLVLAEEWRERGHLLKYCEEELTDYEASSIRAARNLTPLQVEVARNKHIEYKLKIEKLFDNFDNLLIPTVANPSFKIGSRPKLIDGKKVSWLWGAFPFTSPFNVSGSPAASIPFTVSDGLPISIQLVGKYKSDEDLLNICEDLEELIQFKKNYD